MTYIKIGGRIRSVPDNYRRDPFQDARRHAKHAEETAIKLYQVAGWLITLGIIGAFVLGALSLG